MSKKVRFFEVIKALFILPFSVGAQGKSCEPIVVLHWWEDFKAYAHITTLPPEPFCWI